MGELNFAESFTLIPFDTTYGAYLFRRFPCNFLIKGNSRNHALDKDILFSSRSAFKRLVVITFVKANPPRYHVRYTCTYTGKNVLFIVRIFNCHKVMFS